MSHDTAKNEKTTHFALMEFLQAKKSAANNLMMPVKSDITQTNTELCTFSKRYTKSSKAQRTSENQNKKN